jgi:hypothetical protein
MKEAAVAKGQSSNGAAKVAAGVAIAGATIAAAALVVEDEIVGSRGDESDEVENNNNELGENGHNMETSGYLDESRGDESFERHVEEPEQMSSDEGVSHEVEPEEPVEVEAEEDAEVDEPSVPPDWPPSHSPDEHPNEPDSEPEHAEVEETNMDEAILLDASTEEPPPDAGALNPHSILAPEADETHVENAIEPSTLEAGDDIDDIVNLLETTPTFPVSKPRPLSVPSIPDDAPDIPDED